MRGAIDQGFVPSGATAFAADTMPWVTGEPGQTRRCWVVRRPKKGRKDG
jgi:hypothetical protein